ncbi:NUDIX domain-containing protein [Desulfobulbus rhabdoformis]|uniref:nucleotide triphosphate diphosphatase NUDT15 n=1 Tax=Desulfobulbus rhabdoformis TaxID=34032 RepID=UPI0019645781|nr:NUDIX hydrolase [Desulfobulbus rhabdoformis]MBM9616423.1 NUDIX domain-containing protein [Desulfobulbus rhabdoformis]
MHTPPPLSQYFQNSSQKAAETKRLQYCPHCAAPFSETQRPSPLRQQCAQCGYAHHLNPAPGITIILHTLKGKILIGKRAASGSYGGLWCLPGGYIEYEESFIQTAHREVHEETGLEIQVEGVINVVSNLLDESHHTLVIVLLGRVVGGQEAASDDLEQLRWVTQEEHEQTRYAFEGDKKIIDVFFSGDYALLLIDPQAEAEYKPHS